MSHTQKVAIVTAAGRGIGRAIAQRLAHDGYAVVVSDRDDTAEAVAESISKEGGIAVAKIADVTSQDDIDSLVEFALDKYGRIDAAVNNAGVGSQSKKLGEMTDDDWQRAIEVTLSGTFKSMRAELNYFEEVGRGCIVNIASIASLTPNPMRTPYGATKHGVLSLTQSAAVEYAPLGVRVNGVAPGPVNTEAFAGMSEEDQATEKSKVPMRKIGEPSDIASAVSWLVSDESSYVTGAILPVDGGAHHV